MMDTTLLPLSLIVSWNLRNTWRSMRTLQFNTHSIVGAEIGTYPIHRWKTYYIEVPKNGRKADISGRINGVGTIRLQQTPWDKKRLVWLPHYHRFERFHAATIQELIVHWSHICCSDDMPGLALATKCTGEYSEGREAENVVVLLVWPDGVCRIASLDWIEGPMEDCVTPEWCTEVTPLLNLDDALVGITHVHENISWDDQKFVICTLPACLGEGFSGNSIDSGYSLWSREWLYNTYGQYQQDLELALHRINDVFQLEGTC